MPVKAAIIKVTLNLGRAQQQPILQLHNRFSVLSELCDIVVVFVLFIVFDVNEYPTQSDTVFRKSTTLVWWFGQGAYDGNATWAFRVGLLPYYIKSGTPVGRSAEWYGVCVEETAQYTSHRMLTQCMYCELCRIDCILFSPDVWKVYYRLTSSACFKLSSQCSSIPAARWFFSRNWLEVAEIIV